MIQFIELQQYLKGSMYNELGINANFNMKREALSGQEVALNDDALMPLIDDMLKQRRAMCDELNRMFGLEVSVDYGSTWHSNVLEKQLVSETELGADSAESEEAAGDETALPDDKDANSVDENGDVSRLKEEEENEDIVDSDNNSSDDTSPQTDESVKDDVSNNETTNEHGVDDDGGNSDSATDVSEEEESGQEESGQEENKEVDSEPTEKEEGENDDSKSDETESDGDGGDTSSEKDDDDEKGDKK